MTETTQAPKRSLPAWIVLVAVLVITAAALFLFDQWNDQRQADEIDRQTDELVEILCPPSDPC